MIKDGPVLFYCKEGILYPVVLDAENQFILEITCKLFDPLRLVDKPQGRAVDLLEQRAKT